VIGAIDVLSTQINAFDKLDRDALEMLAVQVGTALQNARLYHQAQRRLLEQSVVHQIGQDLASILDFQDLCEAIVQHMSRALDSSACMVGRYEPEHSMVHVEADYRAPNHHAGRSPLLTGAYLTLDDNVGMDGALRSHQPVTVYADDPQAPAAARALLNEQGDHAQLIVPMVRADRVLGVVMWTSAKVANSPLRTSSWRARWWPRPRLRSTTRSCSAICRYTPGSWPRPTSFGRSSSPPSATNCARR
jgi:GAF domain-containing protein